MVRLFVVFTEALYNVIMYDPGHAATITAPERGARLKKWEEVEASWQDPEERITRKMHLHCLDYTACKQQQPELNLWLVTPTCDEGSSQETFYKIIISGAFIIWEIDLFITK